MAVIPYGHQDISDADVQAVVDILHSDFLTQGPAVPAFEKAVADYCGAPYAVAVNSATSALHIACLALGVGPGDRVWTSPITFVASANCALYCGAQVDFVDIDSQTSNLSAEFLAEKLVQAERAGRLPKVVIPVHLGGEPCDMAAMHALSRRYGFKIIEDASHAIGGRYRGEPVGNCRYSDITVFSFHPVKIITTGEGGMAMTRDAQLARRMQLLRSHGITRDEAEMTHPTEGPWYYQQLMLGYNYRMTDLQAALGVSQMRRLDAFVARRQELAQAYDAALAGLPVALPVRADHNRSALHLYVIRLQAEKTGKTRRQVFDALRTADIGVNVHYIPVHLQPYYRSLGFKQGDFPQAEKYYEVAMSLPLFYGLTDDAQRGVISSIRAVLS